MKDPSSVLYTLEGWLRDASGVDQRTVRQLLVDCGYTEEVAADYRSVLLFYRSGWPRWTLMANNPAVPVGYLQRIANTMIPLIKGEHGL